MKYNCIPRWSSPWGPGGSDLRWPWLTWRRHLSSVCLTSGHCRHSGSRDVSSRRMGTLCHRAAAWWSEAADIVWSGSFPRSDRCVVQPVLNAGLQERKGGTITYYHVLVYVGRLSKRALSYLRLTWTVLYMDSIDDIQAIFPHCKVCLICYKKWIATVSVHTGNSVYADWVLGHRLVGQNMMVMYVRAGLECVTICRQHGGCM